MYLDFAVFCLGSPSRLYARQLVSLLIAQSLNPTRVTENEPNHSSVLSCAVTKVCGRSILFFYILLLNFCPTVILMNVSEARPHWIHLILSSCWCSAELSGACGAADRLAALL